MSFTTGNENQTIMCFLHIQITCEDKTFTTSHHYKQTSFGIYAQFDNFLPSTYYFDTVYTLAYTVDASEYSRTKLHTELVCIKNIYLKNCYTESFINVSKD